MQENNQHRWKFYRSGGVDQVTLSSADDLKNLKNLDLKLWMALAMPTKGIEFDEKTTALIDLDGDGRIRPPEVLEAVEWADGVLVDLGELLTPAEALSLSSIKDEEVITGAKRILSDLGKADATEITIEDIEASVGAFLNTVLNGDGVVIPASTEDEAVSLAITDMVSATGGVADISGKMGVDAATVDTFVSDAKAYLAWIEAGKDVESGDHSAAELAAAAEAIDAVKCKVDDYFARCRLLAFDGRATDQLNPNPALYATVAGNNLGAGLQELAPMPLAFIEKEKPLPLEAGVNPAWQGPLKTLKLALTPLFDKEKSEITEDDWKEAQAIVTPFAARLASKPSSGVTTLPADRLETLIGDKLIASIKELIAKDAALAPEYSQLASVEKIVRFKKDMKELLSNFVNFSDFYSKSWAVFQAGTLYLDTRSCNLCIEVNDPAKHATLAALSAAYLAYCNVARPGEKPKQIVAVFTDGDSDNLIVGRNGVFYDRDGNDWDATITKIVANPISIREAFWLPYKKFVRMIEDQIQKRAAAADAESTKKLSAASDKVATADKAASAPAAEPKKMDLGTIALIGTAIGGVSAMVAGFLSSLFGLGIWLPLGIAGILLLISGPSMLLAWMKLRQRNLGPILDANGWAINSRAKMNVPFGAALTNVAMIPAGSDRILTDPYAEKKKPWGLYFFLLVVLVLGVSWFFGKIDTWLPEKATAAHVFGRESDACKVKVEEAPTPEVAPPSEG